jgi:signal transduction histidine kinase
VRQSVGTGIMVEFALAANWLTLCDGNQMDNVILNLAINARDAMPNGGALKIATENAVITAPSPGFDEVAPGEYVRLVVSDTGSGMTEEIRRKAVDPFFTTKEPGKGTGLGLSMTFGYVRQSRGQMNIESEIGRGTKIIILMPRLANATAGAET